MACGPEGQGRTRAQQSSAGHLACRHMYLSKQRVQLEKVEKGKSAAVRRAKVHVPGAGRRGGRPT